jgi:RNA polymerase sigma factor (TIGR02999 family)
VTPSAHEVTRLLRQWAEGDRAALDQLIPLVYAELHKIAKRYMADQSAGHTLQATAVVHEAYLKLAGAGEQIWEDRAHFFAVASKAMRHVLVDYARTQQAAKRGGGVRIVPLEEGVAISGQTSAELVALDDALTELAAVDPRKAQVVELRYFGGLTVEDTARMLGISAETVARDWRFAKSLLEREIKHKTKV